MKISSFFNLNILLLIVPAIFIGFVPGKIVIISAICLYPLLLLVWEKIYYRFGKDEIIDNKPIYFFYFTTCITVVRGLLDLELPNDYVVFFSASIFLHLLVPSYIYVIKKKTIIYILKSILYIGFTLSFFTFFFKPTAANYSFQHNISFIYIFLLMIPYLKRKWILFLILFCMIGIFFDITRRSFLVNSLIVGLIVIFYYLFSQRTLQLIAKIWLYVCTFLPIILLTLGLTGIFNIFTLGENYNYSLKNNTSERQVFVDSRTSIYLDVFSELKNQHKYIFGLGGNGKTKTSLADLVDYDNELYSAGRRSTESGMLNQIQWGGAVSAFSYFLLLFCAAYYAIYKSNNVFFILLGMFISFKIVYSFVEDSISPNLASFYLFISLGMCYNKVLLNLTNSKINKMVNLVFK